MQRLALGLAAANRLRDEVGREVQRPVDPFDDPLSVALLAGLQVTRVAGIGRPSSLRPSARVSTRDPAHATAPGQVLLAFVDPQKTRATRPARPHLEAPTDRPISNPARLAADGRRRKP